ncbi:hypothetical protein ACXWPL_09830, partial [Streptococcus pyogenes]
MVHHLPVSPHNANPESSQPTGGLQGECSSDHPILAKPTMVPDGSSPIQGDDSLTSSIPITTSRGE